MDIFKTSHLRGNIIAWLPIKKTDDVLYFGERDDAAAQKLAQMSENLQCVPLQEADGYLKKNSKTEKYDYIICLGVLAELAALYDNRETKAFSALRRLLKPSGQLMTAVDNPFGLKFLAGAKEAKSGAYFAGIEGDERSGSYTLKKLKEDLTNADFVVNDVYYPFPDYRFAMSIYSDEYLPKQGELIDQIGNFDAERFVFFDEARAADFIIKEKCFSEFSTSYFIAAGLKEADDKKQNENKNQEKTVFVRFSNDRGKAHNIRTYITKTADGKMSLRKTADAKESETQIANMKEAYDALQRIYKNSRFSVNTCIERDEGAELEFLKGHTMEEELDALLDEGKEQEATERFLEVLKEIQNYSEQTVFVQTEEFKEVFGEIDLPQNLYCAPVSDIDMIMANILIREDTGEWTVIDYEWSFCFPIPIHFVLYRAIRYYADTTEKRKKLLNAGLYELAGISKEELFAYEKMEEAFQDYVLKGHVPMRKYYRSYGKPAYHISSLQNIIDDKEYRETLQVYFDRGNGTNEADMVYFHSKALDGTYHVELPIDEDVKTLRIDPSSCACTAEINQMSFVGTEETITEFVCNGHKMQENSYLFDTEDPLFLIEKLPQGKRVLILDMRIEPMSLSAAKWIAPRIDIKYKIKKMLNK